LFTGGDPLVMPAKKLRAYIEPFLSADFKHIKTIRIGSKALSYWPFRFISDEDTVALLKLFREVVKSGKHLAFMAHFNHWIELENEFVRKAIKNIQKTGAVIRSQSPILSNINDSSDVWSKMWRTQYQVGIVPYYMFVERDTGADHYFSVPLYKAYSIYCDSVNQLSGLCRTVRGPSMSATPGKLNVEGIKEINDKKVFVLKFLQARQREWVNKLVFAEYDEKATWLNDLRPAFENEFFFEE
jgi:L-lysine 2,3-aminomutase